METRRDGGAHGSGMATTGARRKPGVALGVPATVSLAVAVCVWLTVSNLLLNDPEALAGLPPWTARFLANELCVVLLLLFVALMTFAVLQAIAAGLDRAAVRAALAPTVPPAPPLYGLRCWLSGTPAVWPNAILRGSRDNTGSASTPSTRPSSAAALDLVITDLEHGERVRLSPLVYGVWVLPLIGFIGTVIGITEAIGGLDGMIATTGDPAAGLEGVLGGLRYAFDTTLLGLVAVIPVMAVLTALRTYSQTTQWYLISAQVTTETATGSPAEVTGAPEGS